MADSGPPPAYPGVAAPPAPAPYDKDFVIVRFRFPNSGFTGGLSTAKFFSEDHILDNIGPVLNKMFPGGNVRFNRNEHMLRCELGYDKVEYWQIQIFKMISARGFHMKTSHASATSAEKVIASTYTFAR
ncbi:uncharacterized protein [Amphiura filiformis]|uniref:uncharacterized protein isoform X3 n=1 Tax=Amphiura filiformis TaxID=82378 RepID=UPI003B214AD9